MEYVTDQDDRLSSLPDVIIIDILSLLPIKSAAATSVLSRRWVHLWTHVTSLHFRHLELPTVRLILRQLVSPNINQLQLEPGNKDIETVFSIVDSCCDHIRPRNVERIEVSYFFFFLRMPTWVLNCQTLVALKLVGTLQVDDTVFLADINLPKLKQLSLWLNDDNRNLMKNMFKCCPSLEDLSLEFESSEAGHLVDMSSPNLKSLCIWMSGPSQSEMVINAPMLSQIMIKNYYTASCYFVQNPTLLMEADVNLQNSFCDDDEEGGVCINSLLSNLVLGISNVRCLKLRNASKIFNYLSYVDDGACPIFLNLTHLDTSGLDCWKDLFYSLRCFPSVEVLEVLRWSMEEDKWNEYERLPTNLFTKLKRMEVGRLWGYESEMKLLEYILSNAGVLERLSVDIYINGKDREARSCKKFKFCETVFKLPKCSPSCEIEFLEHAYCIK